MRYVKFQFSAIERVDLLKAWLATSIAFGIYFTIGEKGLTDITFPVFMASIMFAGITAGVGFLSHELCHKWAASRFGVHSEFRSNDTMLVISIVIAFLGVIFAAPGAVQIYHPITKKENGIISAAGPLANILLTLIPYIKFKKIQANALKEACEILLNTKLKMLKGVQLIKLVDLIMVIQKENYVTKKKKTRPELLQMLGLTP